MRKKCLVYLRYSKDGQSNSSIERQEIIVHAWCQNNEVEITSSLKDEGYTARTFDRPDIKKLFDFIANNAHTIQYLVVSDLTRFSRELGDAVTMVKKIQLTYGVKIVSAYRNSIYDVTDHASYFMMSLEFLMGDTENIKRTSDIRGGIYAAKKKEGRYVHAAPYGYKNVRLENGKPGIAPNEATAPIVQLIFEMFLKGISFNEILKKVRTLGFKQNGNSAIQNILSNKIYIGLLHVGAYKDFAEEWVQGVHEPLITKNTFYAAQGLMKKGKPVQIINDIMPLRGVLKCWCNSLLTGAPSRSRNGSYYYYYKCNVASNHNNISVIKAHAQLQEIWKWISIPDKILCAVKDRSEEMLEKRLHDDAKEYSVAQQSLKALEKQLHNIEDKWINNQMAYETYQRWFPDLSAQIAQHKQKLQHLSKNKDCTMMLLQTELYKLSDLNCMYNSATTLQKQELINLVFDRNLYYRSGVYRTTYVMPVFSSNSLILKDKGLLEIDKKIPEMRDFRLGGADRNAIEPLETLLDFISQIKIA